MVEHKLLIPALSQKGEAGGLQMPGQPEQLCETEKSWPGWRGEEAGGGAEENGLFSLLP